VLTADFGFDLQTEKEDLWRAWVESPLVRCRLEKLAGEVDENPEWSEARVLTALKDAGAKFGPDHKAEFLRALPIEELKPFVGKLEVVSVEFEVREQTETKAYLTWIVRAKWHSPDGRTEADCVLTFEPFEGKLTQYDRGLPKR